MAIKLLIGGSPCTHWSIANGKARETEASGLGWELFKNYLIAKEKFKPDYFLYENNMSAAQPIKDQISKELGVDLMYINSSLVSAQNRKRFYAFNWEVEQPEDRGILLKDIIESGSVDREKSLALCARYAGYSGSQSYLCRRYFGKSFGQAVFEGDIAEIKSKWEHDPYFESNDINIRPLSVTECCRLQTLPDDYCKIATAMNAKTALGNGWTAEVIIHILNGTLKDIPRDEEIIVLSLSMTGLVQVDIVSIRWGLRMSDTMLTKSTNTLLQLLQTTTPTSYNVEMPLLFVKTIGNRLDHNLAQSGWTSCWEILK